ncbi:protein kinase [Asanoa sp. NPDC049518]|uniref:protein kinase domain-containing protein n=1 Tax=unclassified Asanoa TaxID=2685164 RepID=UPI003428DBAC
MEVTPLNVDLVSGSFIWDEAGGNQDSAWTISHILGRGDFAIVYQAERDGQQAAIKLTSRGGSPEQRAQIERDALKQLRHPAIPRVLDEGTWQNSDFFAMSLARGETLQARVTRKLVDGELHGDITTLRILSRLLDALAHVHAQDLVHRDIKDANLVYDETTGNVGLLDFGFCQKSGVAGIRTADSFWRVGAARFSPLAKLHDSSLSHPAHDVFAMGVIGYRLLTGEYPWSVSENEGLEALRQRHKDQPLVSVLDRNSFVAPELSGFISHLLARHDDQRPSAATAAQKARKILDDLTARRAAGGRIARGRPWESRPHVLRDPIHGDIRLSEHEYKILNTKEMQRLRWIRQLGLTSLVFHGAEHSRLSHSIGCVFVVEKMLSTMEDAVGVRIDPELRSVARLFALVHDVPHIAFGHTLEDEFGIWPRHDANMNRFERLLLAPTSQLGERLRADAVGRAVLDLMNPEQQDKPPEIEELVSGATGADVLDYVDRDAEFCGLNHRIDTAIYRQLRIESFLKLEDQHLVSNIAGKYGVRVDRELAVESVLQQRYAMFLKVYSHSAKLASSCLLARAVYDASRQEDPLKEDTVEWLGDEGLLRHLRDFPSGTQAHKCASLILERSIPRGVYRAKLLSRGANTGLTYGQMLDWVRDNKYATPEGRLRLEAEIGRRAEFDPERIFVYCPAKAPGYQTIEHWVMQRKNHLEPWARESGITASHLDLWQFWTFVRGGTEEERRRVANVSQAIVRRPNTIEDYRPDASA